MALPHLPEAVPNHRLLGEPPEPVGETPEPAPEGLEVATKGLLTIIDGAKDFVETKVKWNSTSRPISQTHWCQD